MTIIRSGRSEVQVYFWRMRKALSFLVLLFVGPAVMAQQAGRLEVTVDGLANDTVMLANYYGNRLFYCDTAVANANGELVFDRATGYAPGQYALLWNGKRCELVLNEPLVRLRTDSKDLDGHLTVVQSVENELFRERKRLGTALENAAALHALAEKNAQTLVASMIRMSGPATRDPVLRKNGTLDSVMTDHNFRMHYWDGIDLSDARMVNTPDLQNRFEEFLAVAVPDHSDSIERYVDDLLVRTNGTKAVMQFLLVKVFDRYENMDDRGMDALYVHSAQKYVCGKDSASGPSGMPDAVRDHVCEKARTKAPLIIGAVSPGLVLADTSASHWIDLHAMTNDYTVVVFWSPHCGHCKQALPAFHEKYVQVLRKQGAGVYAVADATSAVLFADWKAFVRENHFSWTDVGVPIEVYQAFMADPQRRAPSTTTAASILYKDTWKVHSTPKYFVLDREHRIIARPKTINEVLSAIAGDRKRSH